MRGNGSTTGKVLPLVYVAVWPNDLTTEGRQFARLRPVCQLCPWRGKIRKTPNYDNPRESRPGHRAAREALRHWERAHPGRSTHSDRL